MEPTLGLLQLTFLTAAAFAVISSLFFGWLYRTLRGGLLRLSPAERARWLFAWAAAPSVLGPLLTAVCFLPSLLELAAPGFLPDHCLAHNDHHAHLCLLHPPLGPGDLLGWIVLGTAGIAVAMSVCRFALRLRRSHAALERLAAAARMDPAEGVLWVAGTSPFALLAGLLRPRLIISEALREQLPPGLLRAVVLHERAHGRRRDVLRLALAAALSMLHLPTMRRTLLQDLRLACEQAADAEAARVVGDPLCIADAILAVERLAHRGPPELMLASAFGGRQLAERIQELVSPSRGRTSLRVRVVLAAALVLLVLGAEPLHHLAETVLTPLTR
jgi:hypothetical protein